MGVEPIRFAVVSGDLVERPGLADGTFDNPGPIGTVGDAHSTSPRARLTSREQSGHSGRVAETFASHRGHSSRSTTRLTLDPLQQTRSHHEPQCRFPKSRDGLSTSDSRPRIADSLGRSPSSLHITAVGQLRTNSVRARPLESTRTTMPMTGFRPTIEQQCAARTALCAAKLATLRRFGVNRLISQNPFTFRVGKRHADHLENRPLTVRKCGKRGLYPVGRRRFELRLRPPEGRRIPSYPTGPHS